MNRREKIKQLEIITNTLEREVLKLQNPPKYKISQVAKFKRRKGKYIVTDIIFSKSIDWSICTLRTFWSWKYTFMNKKTGKKFTMRGKQIKEGILTLA